MTALHLAANELRRLTASRMGRLALAALILVPTIYAGLYLYANKDPYAGFTRVPAAVVVEDRGTTLATGEKLTAGATVGHDLVESRSFDWHEVSRAEAEHGVSAGDYDFALIVPQGFSADLASSAQFTPRQAQMELLTNDANNYMAHTIANQVVAQVTKSVASQVTRSAANQLLLGFSTIHDNVKKAVDGATQLHDGLVRAKSGADQLASGSAALVSGQQQLVDGSQKLADGAGTAAAGATRLSAGAATLAGGLGTLDRKTQSLPSQATALADGAQQVADGNAQIADVATQVAGASQQAVDALGSNRAALNDRLRQAGLTPEQIVAVGAELDKLAVPIRDGNTKVQGTSAKLSQLSGGANQVAAGARTLAAGAGPLREGIHQASTGAAQLRDGAATLSTGVGALSTGATQLHTGEVTALSGSQRLAAGATQLQGGLGTLVDGSAQLQSGLVSGLKQIPDPSEKSRTAVAETLGNPVGVTNASQSSAANYGAGLAPFFLSLALWIGAYTLFLLVKPVSARAVAANQPSLRVALGGWLAPALAGIGQALIAYAVVVLGLGIHVANPVGTLALMFFVSMTFVAILHALSARLGSIGKFLGLVFMVVQLVAAGGTFPWQTLPTPLHGVHHVVPMSYAIDGIRRLMYGADLGPLGTDLAVLTAYLAGALVLSTVAARRARMWSAKRLKPEISL